MSEGERARKQRSLETQDPMILLTENKREKVFGNLLTNFQDYDIITTKDKEKENSYKTRKDTAMKKASMEALVNYIDVHSLTELFNIKDELTAELNKSKAKADANRALYDEYHDKIIAALASATAPVTAQELADETGIARGKIVYGLTNYWKSEVVRDDSGKTATYTLA